MNQVVKSRKLSHSFIEIIVAAVETCQEGSLSVSTGCYSFPVTVGGMTWQNSKDYCIAQGGSLVEITSEAEQAAITAKIRSEGWGNFNFWIGLTDLDSEGTFKWVSGDAVNYTHWAPGEPNNQGHSGGPEDCAHIGDGGRTWNDMPCDDSQGWGNNFLPLCEFKSDTTAVLSKEFLSPDSAVVSGPAECLFSLQDSKCKTVSGLCLSGGSNMWEGNVFFDGQPVCDDFWTIQEASLVCSSLSFGRAKNFTTNSHFGTVKGPLREADCKRGSEYFSNCTLTSNQQCIPEEVAGVVCETEDEKMRRVAEEERLNECFITGVEYFTSSTNIGLTNTPEECQQLCASQPLCTHFSFNELTKLCYNTTGSAKVAKQEAVSGPRNCDWVRTAMVVTEQACLHENKVCLGNPNDPPTSQIEVNQGNIFVGGKPVCDDGWSLTSAEVLCAELQFYGVKMITKASHFGFTSGHFAMDQVACHGNETRLADCPHLEKDRCYGGEAAGVICDVRPREVIMREKALISECFVEDVIYWGNPINVSLPNITSSIECQKKCQLEDSCTHFTFWPTAIALDFQDCDEICLKGGSGPHEGTVMVNKKPVCDDGWRIEAGNVVCRQLGFLGALEVKKESYFGREGSDFSMDQVQCQGDEARLTDCSYSTQDDCGASEAASVICMGKQVQGKADMLCELYSGSEKGRNKTFAGGAITGPKTCPSQDDLPSVCSPNPDVSADLCLEGGEVQGNVFYMGKPVCDDGWDFFAANQVCKELDYTRARRPTSGSEFGIVPQSFSLDEVQCNGNETGLSNCTASDVENCDGSEGAGVECDIRSQTEVAEWDRTLTRDCFSRALYRSLVHMTYNKSSSSPGPFTDNAASCQAVCNSTFLCDAFTFEQSGRNKNR